MLLLITVRLSNVTLYHLFRHLPVRYKHTQTYTWITNGIICPEYELIYQKSYCVFANSGERRDRKLLHICSFLSSKRLRSKEPVLFLNRTRHVFFPDRILILTSLFSYTHISRFNDIIYLFTYHSKSINLAKKDSRSLQCPRNVNTF